jgi:hypothetical protein
MPLRVVSCCTYLTGTDGIVWRPRDYDAHDFIMAVKGWTIGGFAQIPCRGRIHRIDDGNRDLALQLFARMITDLARGEEGLAPPVVLVPVPNSACHLGSSQLPRTRAQAEALARELGPGATVWDGLRWTAPLAPARSERGTRDPGTIFERLARCAIPPRPASRVVLIDDLLATGGHLQACAAMFRRWGCAAGLALAAGRSDPEPADDPFGVRLDLLADFSPPSERRT